MVGWLGGDRFYDPGNVANSFARKEREGFIPPSPPRLGRFRRANRQNHFGPLFSNLIIGHQSVPRKKRGHLLGSCSCPFFSAAVVAPIKEENFDKDHQLGRRERRKEWKKGI